ncbi:MAG: hypothetical protein M1829_001535 [Trizodia sp. TS-e1964]|nr:MAG: hypothetical protein M1829_001535 [Trizodia sp. TS-e1964]
MDFWSRLIGGLGASPASRQSSVQSPQQRLARFKRCYANLVQTYRSVPNLSDPIATNAIRESIHRLITILKDESRAPAPHLCASFALSSQVYNTIAKVAGTSLNEGVISEGVLAFRTLIDNEEDFTNDNDFAQSLMEFVVKVAGNAGLISSVEAEGEVVELLFGIAAKIRSKPDLLPVWFTPEDMFEPQIVDKARTKEQKFVGVTHKEDFPLFYLLIDYVHHEGKVGDFARTGLVYIIESASTSEDLERWIVESDMATLMASGLAGAETLLTYLHPDLTLFARKLVMTFSKDDPPAILALSDYAEPAITANAESSTSPEFLLHLNTFLSYLVFWQDVLEHCKSSEVKQTLLDHFQVLFLQQLLYPSLLESSDVDGGSSVAVITYLRRILDSINYPDLIHLILHYLLALPVHASPPITTSPGVARRRKSLDLLTQFANTEEKPSPMLFNLVDLILTSLSSNNQQTINATLELVSVILRKHHRYAISSLLRVIQVNDKGNIRTIGGHQKDLELLFNLAEEIGWDEDFDLKYSNHIKDSMALLELHPCTRSLLHLGHGGGLREAAGITPSIEALRPIYHHTLRPEDSILKTLLALLKSFFSNTVETNLSLTAAIVDLAACGYMRIEGWLLTDPQMYEYDEESSHDNSEGSNSGDDEMELVMARSHGHFDLLQSQPPDPSQDTYQRPSHSHDKASPIIHILATIVHQFSSFRREVPMIDEYLAARKLVFKETEQLSEPLRSSSPAPRTPTPSSFPKPSTKPLDSISQRIFPSRPSSVSRPASPRGRNINTFTSPTSQRSSVLPALPSLSRPESVSSTRGRRALSTSPLRESAQPLDIECIALDPTILARTLDIKPPCKKFNENATTTNSPTSCDESSGAEDEDLEDAWPKVSVNHILTSAVILQDFILELASLVQVRASLFRDVRFN